MKNGIQLFSYLIEAGLQTYVMLKVVQNTKNGLSTTHTLVENCVNHSILNFPTLQSHVAGAWTERKKMFHGGSFLKLADDDV